VHIATVLRKCFEAEAVLVFQQEDVRASFLKDVAPGWGDIIRSTIKRTVGLVPSDVPEGGVLSPRGALEWCRINHSQVFWTASGIVLTLRFCVRSPNLPGSHMQTPGLHTQTPGLHLQTPGLEPGEATLNLYMYTFQGDDFCQVVTEAARFVKWRGKLLLKIEKGTVRTAVQRGICPFPVDCSMRELCLEERCNHDTLSNGKTYRTS